MNCRYCLEEEGAFISPCRCSGSVKHVHESCLNKWIETIPLDRDINCPICLYNIPTNHVFEKYLMNSKHPLNTNGFYLFVLFHILIGIIISRSNPELLYSTYLHAQIGTHLAYLAFILLHSYKLNHKKLFIVQYTQPGPVVLLITQTYILWCISVYGTSIDQLTYLWLTCISHLIYPLHVREINECVESVNKYIARKPRVYCAKTT
jgi:hypothetical protein